MTPRGTRGDDQNKRLLEAANIVARPLAPRRGPRLLCMVYATAERHADNVRAIRETWAPGCDGFLTLSTRNDSRVPALALPHGAARPTSSSFPPAVRAPRAAPSGARCVACGRRLARSTPPPSPQCQSTNTKLS